LEEEGVKQVRVLIVDDLEFMRTAIREILQSAGSPLQGKRSTAWTASGSTTSFARCRSHDITIRGSTASTPSNEYDARIPGQGRHVLFPGAGPVHHQGDQLGARDFIVKPFRPQRVVSAVKKAAGVEE
jgi:two-component system chemotaxis response regulator CheY